MDCLLQAPILRDGDFCVLLGPELPIFDLHGHHARHIHKPRCKWHNSLIIEDLSSHDFMWKYWEFLTYNLLEVHEQKHTMRHLEIFGSDTAVQFVSFDVWTQHKANRWRECVLLDEPSIRKCLLAQHDGHFRVAQKHVGFNYALVLRASAAYDILNNLYCDEVPLCVLLPHDGVLCCHDQSIQPIWTNRIWELLRDNKDSFCGCNCKFQYLWVWRKWPRMQTLKLYRDNRDDLHNVLLGDWSDFSEPLHCNAVQYLWRNSRASWSRTLLSYNKLL